ncbi:hypothetical protein ACTZWW_03310 [Salinarimonas sp. NSM]|uniref:hypothetical protein n=1 Tax=Salinarimonas sp. NSM TaxID=3458003 RepID=UPI004036AD89
MNHLALAGLAAAATLVLATPVGAQEVWRDPAYGRHDLRAGFTPDPYTIEVVAGGSNDASDLGGACTGSIATAPDLRLYYVAGTLPLTITTRAGEDTTLVVNGPDKEWYCNDDGGGGVDARVRFDRPQSGRYDIWVGQYDGGMDVRTRVEISEY